ncbi:hypothetical protein PENTCL1PPCAC_28965 [Pristionchus entomophagus]|uniref:Uncharacterized protein n=1 Tax=Pristionchus entomophagus TaxID=358040 RepID=A0AAV5UI93_9BILA|nr:hypothetical protein PENTCL1PPCAC_28965 [Pristionchus entomophagus]
MTGAWRKYQKSNNFSLIVGTLSYFMRTEFEREVREERMENRALVLYRTEQMLDGRGVLEPLPVDTVELQITSMMCHIYRLVDVLDDREVLRRLREYIKRYSDRFVFRFLDERIGDLMRSAKVAKTLVQGTHFGFIQTEGKNSLVATSCIDREQLGALQFLQIHHSLPVTPLSIATLKRSPLHLLKAYDRKMGIFRRGGYGLREWLPFLTQLAIYPSRVYPHDAPVTPIFSMPPSATISEWIVQVEQLMRVHTSNRKIPQRGVRLIVCPSTAAITHLWRYLKYSHDVIVQLTTYVVCTGTSEQLERTLFGRNGNELVTVFTSAAHFETWHTRYLCDLYEVTVFLGTPSREVSYLHRAYRFARPVMNVITVPFEPSTDHSSNDSGFESDRSGGSEEQRKMCAQALSQVDNHSHWAKKFMKEMWGREDWKAPLSCPEDAKYEKCVEWMRKKWKEESKEENQKNFDEWREKMMQKYGGKKRH